MKIVFGYIKRKKYLYFFFSILLGMGFLLGIFLGITNHSMLEPFLTTYANHVQGFPLSGIFLHFGILAFLVISSFFVIGVPFLIFAFFLEGMVMGFLIGAFTVSFQLSGLVFAILFVLILHFVFVSCLFLLLPKCLEISRSIVSKVVYKTENDLHIFKLIKGTFCLIGIVLLHDCFLCLTSSSILNVFRFLLV